jgi:hypothetical protein
MAIRKTLNRSPYTTNLGPPFVVSPLKVETKIIPCAEKRRSQTSILAEETSAECAAYKTKQKHEHRGGAAVEPSHLRNVSSLKIS